MARPVEATPVLKGKEARRFDAKIREDLKKPALLKETPKLEEARKLAKQHALKEKKCI